MGAWPGRQQRPDRHDPHASDHRRRGSASAVRSLLPARSRLSVVGTVSTAGQGEYGGLHDPGFPVKITAATAGRTAMRLPFGNVIGSRNRNVRFHSDRLFRSHSRFSTLPSGSFAITCIEDPGAISRGAIPRALISCAKVISPCTVIPFAGGSAFRAAGFGSTGR